MNRENNFCKSTFALSSVQLLTWIRDCMLWKIVTPYRVAWITDTQKSYKNVLVQILEFAKKKEKTAIQAGKNTESKPILNSKQFIKQIEWKTDKI